MKRGRVSQEDDSDQPFRENFMRKKYPIKKFQNCKMQIRKDKIIPKGDHSNEDRKSHSKY